MSITPASSSGGLGRDLLLVGLRACCRPCLALIMCSCGAACGCHSMGGGPWALFNVEKLKAVGGACLQPVCGSQLWSCGAEGALAPGHKIAPLAVCAHGRVCLATSGSLPTYPPLCSVVPILQEALLYPFFLHACPAACSHASRLALPPIKPLLWHSKIMI